ncbi:NADH dehydrogenase [ubiquinone] 1 alpha subcomplex assembly factor 2-like [Glandiceps talaboti]
MNLVRNLFRPFRSAKKLVGTDHLGNKYYEVEKRTTKFGGERRKRRFVESGISYHEYEPGLIPIEWESWIRWKRGDPPTMEEVLRREKMTMVVKERAKELERKDKERQESEYEEGLVAKPTQTVPKGHASAPVYERTDGTGEATTTGSEFQPSSWQPPGKK